MLCKYCYELNAETLCKLAQIQASKHYVHYYKFANDAYYHHQPSYTSLIASAQAGCELCNFIWNGFKDYSTNMKQRLHQTAYTLDIERVISEKQEQDLPTDIRLCIDASYCFNTQDPKKILLFDVLAVQVGDEFDSDEDPSLNLPLKFRLSVPRGTPKVLDIYQVGRYITDPDLGSAVNFDMARHWWEKCCADHLCCPTLQESDLPTRVIDVGNVHEDGVSLVLSGGSQGTYIALSHGWGGEAPLKVLGSNLDQFVSGISLDDLPANFRDAVLITRQFGLRYIWIDSLCIIQDSFSDWEQEARRMGDIYQHATLFNETGIRLNLRSTIHSEDCIRIFPKDEEEENCWSLLTHESWVSRGWTFQERILPSRVLYYGRRQIYWQCRRGYRVADNIPEGIDYPQDINYPKLAEYLHQRPVSKAGSDTTQNYSLYDEWYGLVSEYSSKNLSFDSDKFPALAGLAAKFAELTTDEYIVGIWLRDFRCGLLWIPELGNAIPVRPYRAPSWSWASTNDAIIFPYSRDTRASTEYDVKLVSHRIESKAINLFAQVDGGCLVLDGLTLPLLRSQQFIQRDAQLLRDGGYNAATFDQPTKHGTGMQPIERLVLTRSADAGPAVLSVLVPSNGPDLSLKSEIDEMLIFSRDCLIVFVSYWESKNPKAARASALIVSPTNDDNEFYRRVGIAGFHPLGTDGEAWLKDWGWTWRMLKLV